MPDNAREIFVRNLNEIMERRGISQADIIRELDVSSATVSNWCTGKKYPRIDAMQRLADLLGVNLSTLTTESGLDDMKNLDRLEAMHQNPRLGLLFDHTAKMDSEQVEAMIQMSRMILKERDPHEG